MDAPVGVATLPTLIYVYHPRSFPTMSIIDAARDRCSMIWVVDSSDPRLGAMPRLLARTGVVIDAAGKSVSDVAALLAPKHPNGILTLADDFLGWTAALATALVLPFHSPRSATLLTDKLAQRRAFGEAGLATPGAWVVSSSTTDTSWQDIADEVTFPAVLKPRTGEGSRDTMRVMSLDRVRAIVADGLTDDDREWVLEEYIPDIDRPVCGEGFANYVSVESFVQDGEITHLAVTGRTPPAYPFRETGFFIPADVSDDTSAGMKDLAQRGSEALGISLGCLHTEIKMTPMGPVIIEVNGRIGGGIPELLSLTTPIDFLGIALQLAVGARVEVEPPAPDGLSYLLYVQAPADMREVTAVHGLDDLRLDPSVVEITMNRGPGQHVHWRDGNHGHVFSVLGKTVDWQSLRHALARVNDVVTIEGR